MTWPGQRAGDEPTIDLPAAMPRGAPAECRKRPRAGAGQTIIGRSPNPSGSRQSSGRASKSAFALALRATAREPQGPRRSCLTGGALRHTRPLRDRWAVSLGLRQGPIEVKKAAVEFTGAKSAEEIKQLRAYVTSGDQHGKAAR